MPYSQNYWAGDLVTINATVQSNWLFSYWKTFNNTVLPSSTTLNASFFANSSDSCVIYIYQIPLEAFISGNDSICSNSSFPEVKISFSGGEPP